MDTALGGNGRLGLAISQGQGAAALSVVHPYLAWSNGTTTLTALGGVGRSTGRDRTPGDGQYDVNAGRAGLDTAHAGLNTQPLRLHLGRTDLARPLGSLGGISLALRGDVAWARLAREDDAGHTLQAENTRTLRLGLRGQGLCESSQKDPSGSLRGDLASITQGHPETQAQLRGPILQPQE